MCDQEHTFLAVFLSPIVIHAGRKPVVLSYAPKLIPTTNTYKDQLFATWHDWQAGRVVWYAHRSVGTPQVPGSYPGKGTFFTLISPGKNERKCFTSTITMVFHFLMMGKLSFWNGSIKKMLVKWTEIFLFLFDSTGFNMPKGQFPLLNNMREIHKKCEH